MHCSACKQPMCTTRNKKDFDYKTLHYVRMTVTQPFGIIIKIKIVVTILLVL